MHRDARRRGGAGQRVLLIDDLIATGGTAEAAAGLVEQAGGKVVGCGFLIDLTFLKGAEKLKKYDVHSLIQYDSEEENRRTENGKTEVFDCENAKARKGITETGVTAKNALRRFAVALEIDDLSHQVIGLQSRCTRRSGRDSLNHTEGHSA